MPSKDKQAPVHIVNPRYSSYFLIALAGYDVVYVLHPHRYLQPELNLNANPLPICPSPFFITLAGFSCVRFCCDAEPLIKLKSLSPFPMWGIIRDLFLTELGDIRA